MPLGKVRGGRRPWAVIAHLTFVPALPVSQKVRRVCDGTATFLALPPACRSPLRPVCWLSHYGVNLGPLLPVDAPAVPSGLLHLGEEGDGFAAQMADIRH